MTKLTCEICSIEFIAKSPYKKTCSKECDRKRVNKMYGFGESGRIINRQVNGAVSELKVCCDLMDKGYEVFRCVAAHSRFDLIAYKDKKCIFVEVKTGYRAQSGRVGHPQHKHTEHNVLAVYVRLDEKVYYYEPLEEKEIQL